MCGLISPKLTMIAMNPQLVIDHHAKDKDTKYGYDVRQLLTSMQEKKK